MLVRVLLVLLVVSGLVPKNAIAEDATAFPSSAALDDAHAPGLEADLDLVLDTDVDTVAVGDAVTVTLAVYNDGPQTATEVVVALPLPDGLVVDPATPPAFSDPADTFDAATGHWHVGAIDVDMLTPTPHAEMTLTLRAAAEGTYALTAEVLAAAQDDPDSTPGNGDPQEDDYQTVPLTVTSGAVAPRDLSLSMRAGGEARPGALLTYTLTYTNAGPDAPDVRITETVPEHTRFEAAASTGGWQAEGDGRYGLALGAVPSEVQGQVTFAVTVADPLPEAASEIVNTASIVWHQEDGVPGPDLTPSNNTADATTPVVRPGRADVSLALRAGASSATVGDEIEVTLTLDNAGPDAADSVVVRLTVDDALHLHAHSGDGTLIDGRTWRVGRLGEDGTAGRSLVVRPEVPGTLHVRAEVIAQTPEDPDSTPDNGAADEDDADAMALTATLAAPVLLQPDDEAEGVERPVALTWEAVSGATAYRVEVTDETAFAEVVAAVTQPARELELTDLPAGTMYRWRVRALHETSEADPVAGPWSAVRRFTVAGTETSRTPMDLPETTELLGVFPTPFTVRATIRYALIRPSPVRLTVHDVQGRTVVRLVDRRQSAGLHRAALDADGLSSGVYVVRLEAGPVRDTGTLVLVR
ncbi:MAG: DUF11 domain-containing protein [Bacteroidetes bacterium]|jgi:uncharacterized repeat protein (TIGR01451 family)|nr:DUF11 domain-containing protein [Bacteroidota bacterium]